MSDVITNLKKFKKGWVGGLPETPCGFGSTLANTKKQREWIPEMLKKYNIETINDVGAGDLNWFTKMNLYNNYSVIHFDLVPRKSNVMELDIINETVPEADLTMCLWVLNHLPFNSMLKAFNNLVASKSNYYMITDRPKYHADTPEIIKQVFKDCTIEQIVLNAKSDSIRLIKL